MQANTPGIWQKYFPRASREDHKYSRGHAVILGGAASHSGAVLLAAEAALRAGAGLATLLVPKEVLEFYAVAAKRAVIKRSIKEMPDVLEDERPQAWLAGPGLGVASITRSHVSAILETGKPAVLDADALTSFEQSPEELYSMLHEHCVLTPHEGEFARIFPGVKATEKAERVRQAAEQSGAVVLLKGADTVIAAPSGEMILNSVDAPQLATAGSGDVLAGLCVGLMAQGMPAFYATAAAAWIHGKAGQKLGRGLLADDLLLALPGVIQGV